MTTLGPPLEQIEPKPPEGASAPIAIAAPMRDPLPWHATIPTDRCFFAVIDAAALGSPAPSLRQLRQMVLSRSPALDEALQRWVPVPVEQLHTAFALLEPRTPAETPLLIACAVERAVLDGLPEGTLSAAPEALPSALAGRLSDRAPPTAALNLLVGELQPRAIKSAHRRLSLVTAAGFVLVVGLMALGFSRRAAHDQARADSLLAAATAVELRAAPRDGQRSTDPNRARLLLTAEIARMRSASTGPADQGIDAGVTLADVIARWPRAENGRAPSGLYARLQSIQVVATGISLTVIIPADADPEPVLAGLRALPGWQLQPTQRSLAPLGPSGKPEARLTLRLIPVPASSSPASSSSPARPS